MDIEPVAFFLLSLPPLEAASLLLVGASGCGRYTQVSGVLEALITAEASWMGRSSAMIAELALVKACEAEELHGWRSRDWQPTLEKLTVFAEILLGALEMRRPTIPPWPPAQVLAGPREGRARIPTGAVQFQARNEVDIGLWLASLPEESFLRLKHIPHKPRTQPPPLQRILTLTAMGVELVSRGRLPLPDVLQVMRGQPSENVGLEAYLSSR